MSSLSVSGYPASHEGEPEPMCLICEADESQAKLQFCRECGEYFCTDGCYRDHGCVAQCF